MQNKNLVWLNGIVPTDPMIRRKYGFDNIDWIELSKYYWSKYCEIHDGIDLYHYEKVGSPYTNTNKHRVPWTRWFDQIKFLERPENSHYEKVYSVDASTLINLKECPNIFTRTEREPDNDFWGTRDFANLGWTYDGIVGYEDICNYNNIKYDHTRYFAAGHVLYDVKKMLPMLKKLEKFYNDNMEVILEKQNHSVRKGTDQVVFNWLVQSEGIKYDLSLLDVRYQATHFKRYEWDKAADGYLRQNYILSISGMSKKDERGVLMKELHELLLNLYPDYIGAVK